MMKATIEDRLHRLEAIDAIRALKARYAMLADAKYTPDYQRVGDKEMQDLASQQASCFTEDAVWKGSNGFGGDLRGREELSNWFMSSPWNFAIHYYVSPEIRVDDGHATATWRLWQLALRRDCDDAVVLAAVTDEGYRLEGDGGWLCSSMEFKQIHMATVGAGPGALAKSLDELSKHQIFKDGTT
ncbi:nuclear transport factor 2 family protein [Cupriavidus pinatubonensis]|uniref:SnoaL-like domain-containing protein n=1 Tax=Cupriavidus pinatubonensis TaxID=248026 RepID=A0ABM8Y489_9BURK|nr:nuclear transport factor 2 family protein [Cupriavidus pinatubonensis]CAG9187576.1 hypothetical protein LMG23994_07021 [Cupriavidus pinatubonensis]